MPLGPRLLTALVATLGCARPALPLYGAAGLAGGEVFAVGAAGLVLVSRGGGELAAAPSGTRQPLRAAAASPEAGLVAVGGFGAILHSADLGRSFASRPTEVEGALTAVKLFGAEVYAAGEGGVILRSDDGRAFRREDSGTARTLYGGAWLPGGGAVAVGEAGTLLTKSGPDRPWRLEPSGTTATLFCALRADGALYLLGDRGTILRRRDGEARFTRIESGTARALYAAFAAGGRLLVVGDRGTILSSEDGERFARQRGGVRRFMRQSRRDL
jgi:photosystem II stability/assembly factor-like uncharacterized protein